MNHEASFKFVGTEDFYDHTQIQKLERMRKKKIPNSNEIEGFSKDHLDI